MSLFPLDKVRQFFLSDKLWVETSSAWGSHQPDSRTQLRQRLRDKVEQLVAEKELASHGDGKALLDLAQPPQWPDASLSISHCRTRGGFVVAHHPLCVGFDMEEVERVQARIVARMSQSQELEQAPSPAALWVAKESAFKALFGARQPLVISQLLVDQWLPLEPEMWSYRVHHDNDSAASGSGLVLLQGRLIFGLSAFRA